MAGRTPSQTVGPFFHEALRWKDGGKVPLAGDGEAVVLVGRITDGGGGPVGDAMVETWQLLPQGAAAAAGNPRGFARVETARDGTFRIETRMPPGKAPFLEVTIFARGLLKPLRTRVYLAPESAVRADPLLASIASSERIATLLAHRGAQGEYRWDVRLQGEGETVFFAA
jgi:protocatechuate 3,4-dioxygenase alpha subunit